MESANTKTHNDVSQRFHYFVENVAGDDTIEHTKIGKIHDFEPKGIEKYVKITSLQPGTEQYQLYLAQEGHSFSVSTASSLSEPCWTDTAPFTWVGPVGNCVAYIGMAAKIFKYGERIFTSQALVKGYFDQNAKDSQTDCYRKVFTQGNYLYFISTDSRIIKIDCSQTQVLEETISDVEISIATFVVDLFGEPIILRQNGEVVDPKRNVCIDLNDSLPDEQIVWTDLCVVGHNILVSGVNQSTHPANFFCLLSPEIKVVHVSVVPTSNSHPHQSMSKKIGGKIDSGFKAVLGIFGSHSHSDLPSHKRTEPYPNPFEAGIFHSVSVVHGYVRFAICARHESEVVILAIRNNNIHFLRTVTVCKNKWTNGDSHDGTIVGMAVAGGYIFVATLDKSTRIVDFRLKSNV